MYYIRDVFRATVGAGGLAFSSRSSLGCFSITAARSVQDTYSRRNQGFCSSVLNRANMTTQCKSCWEKEIAPPVAADYANKGVWKNVGDLSTYTTGPSGVSKAVVLIYDIFGISPQVLQGADRIAEHLRALVLLPDYFKGAAPNHDEYMKNPDENKAALREFMTAHANFNDKSAETLTFAHTVKQQFPDVRSWGVFGLCWGGKVAVLASLAKDTPFKVSGQTHPAALNADEARAMTVPHICLTSKDEPADVVAEYKTILEEKEMGEVEVFESSIHGWMGARANLQDEDQRTQYEKGYASVARFFNQHL